MPPLPIIAIEASRTPLGRWRGICPSCEGNFALRGDATMRTHRDGRGIRCRGSMKRPQRRTRQVTRNTTPVKP